MHTHYALSPDMDMGCFVEDRRRPLVGLLSVVKESALCFCSGVRCRDRAAIALACASGETLISYNRRQTCFQPQLDDASEN